mmetsp:Transcript_10383/g.19437  ORF Transcript_10383/g.19437 Transcript_10383/m.19437 type:complete len:239 (+) Transcript_10383:363-1079(+)|eukprot:CAMPEP_0176487852 /NCGR_PEP_ID=MMETSP0200_2-20121128/6374_1 /TAXON_ID=947934 /ORGANISM="Chaetoceros sp., Strain GSL56" /LENGTH=238 /DNA_ID=CAMNT_0017884751 /DNA_START=156 /DNA_END=872 /DNA_ORIENTATION=-
MGNCVFFDTRNKNENKSSNNDIVGGAGTTAPSTITTDAREDTTTAATPALAFERVDSSINNTVWNLTKRQEDECEEIFSVFEEDDGMIHISHIGPMMRALNYKPSDMELSSLTNRFQTPPNNPNGTDGGRINFQTFLQIMAPRITKANEVYSEEKIKAAFHRFDKDHNGYITASELRLALQDNFCPGMKRVAEALTDEDVEEIMNEADLDGDGRISFAEFKEMIPHLSESIYISVKIK